MGLREGLADRLGLVLTAPLGAGALSPREPQWVGRGSMGTGCRQALPGLGLQDDGETVHAPVGRVSCGQRLVYLRN